MRNKFIVFQVVFLTGGHILVVKHIEIGYQCCLNIFKPSLKMHQFLEQPTVTPVLKAHIFMRKEWIGSRQVLLC